MELGHTVQKQQQQANAKLCITLLLSYGQYHVLETKASSNAASSKRKNCLVAVIAPTRGCSVDSLALRWSASSGIRFALCSRTPLGHAPISSQRKLTGGT